MISTLIDTNVLLDIVERRPHWGDWSSKTVFDARLQGPVILNPIVYAEASIPYPEEADFEEIIYGMDVLQSRNILHRDLKF